MKLMVGMVLTGLFFFAGCGHVKKLEHNDYTPATLKYQPKLFYPVQAQKNDLSGVTTVMAYVDREGRVKKVNITRSSGYQILDSTAERHCRDLTFNPASLNGKPIDIWLKLKIKFDVSRENMLAQRFVQDITNLYKKAAASTPAERKDIQKQILSKDNEFVENMNDALNFNSAIEKVLLPETVADWKKYWDNYPLSFLLYYDFIQRFPDFDELPAVKAQMLDALRYDIHFLKHTPELENDSQVVGERLLQKLQEFAKDSSLNFSQNNSVITMENV